MIKLVIFDLDDTLIDKWNTLFPATIEVAIKTMMNSGLKVSSFDGAVSRLSEINDNNSESLNSAMEIYLRELNSYTPKYIEEAENSIRKMDFSGKIKPLPGVVEMIEQLFTWGVNMVIVTKGEEEMQKRSFDISGLNPKNFRKIIAVPKDSKIKAYNEILENLKILANETLIVGDRYEADLLPGKKLGAKVAWIPKGRGRINPPRKDQVDYIINNMNELTKIVKDFSNK